MKKYTKPTVEIVNLKSSNDIAASFEQVQKKMVRNYLLNGTSTEYAVSKYSNAASVVNAEA